MLANCSCIVTIKDNVYMRITIEGFIIVHI